MRVGLVGDDVVRPLARTPWAGPRYRDVLQQRQQLWVVASLARGEPNRDRQPASVDSEVDLAGQSSSGPPNPFALAGEVIDPSGGTAPLRSSWSPTGTAGLQARYDLSPLSVMIEKVVSPSLVVLVDH